MASLIPSETVTNFLQSPTTFLVTLQDQESFGISNNLILKFTVTERKPLHLLTLLHIIHTNAFLFAAVQNARNKVISAKTAVIINVKDASGEDQDTLPLTAKRKITVGEKK
jgi:hypothetical protein